MTAVEEAKQLLASLPLDYPFTFVDSGDGEAYGMPMARVGGIRSKSGQAVIVPIAESSSMIAGFPATLDFLTRAPEVMAKLVEEAEKAPRQVEKVSEE